MGQKAGFIETSTAAPARSPLAGKRVVVTRTQEQSVTLLEKLNVLGATPILLPTIRIEPVADFAALDAALRTHDRYDWLLLTSANAVTILAERLSALGLTAPDLRHLQIAVVGPATTDALRACGLTPTFVPQRFEASEIATGLQKLVGDLHDLRILLPQAAIARQSLAAALTAQGAIVDLIPIYHTLPAPFDGSAVTELQHGVDVITFTSGSTVRNFVQGLADHHLSPALVAHTTIACIGPQTAAAAQEVGLPVDLVADDYTIDGLVDALVVYFQKGINPLADNEKSSQRLHLRDKE
jgi:uroporphyrinogen III methyltransferase/synthase